MVVGCSPIVSLGQQLELKLLDLGLQLADESLVAVLVARHGVGDALRSIGVLQSAYRLQVVVVRRRDRRDLDKILEIRTEGYQNRSQSSSLAMTVAELPPSDSWSRRVSLELR